jgi:phosphocarrier protein
MINYKFALINEHGLHARPISLIVKEAGKYDSDVFLVKDGIKCNCKSILNLMSLGAEKGTELEFIFDGSDESSAKDAFVELVEAGFYE